MREIRLALLGLASLLLVGLTDAQEPTYVVSGTYNNITVELDVDEAAGVAHVRLTNAGAHVVDLGWGPFANDKLLPYRDLTQLPFRGSFMSPSRNAPTTKLKPNEILRGDVELVMPEAADGPFTHWCYAGAAEANGQVTLFRVCEPAS